MAKKRPKGKPRERGNSTPSASGLGAASDEYFATMDRLWRERHEKYLAFCESIRTLDPLPRAEGWLSYAAQTSLDYGDEEALVYATSRGIAVPGAIDALISRWKRSEERAIEAADTGRATWHSDGTVTHFGRLTPHEIRSGIASLSMLQLGDFWPHRLGDWTQDAAMLRAVEWCDIGGFDGWWTRLGRSNLDEAIEGGLEPIPLVYFMFAISRSPYAIDTARRAWERNLDMLEHLVDGNDPWIRVYWRDDKPRLVAQLGYAGCLAFASARIRGESADASRLSKIGELLMAHQNSDGGWSIWAEHNDSNVTTTAIAIHALSCTNVRGRDRAMERGAAWLWKQQSEFGFWKDNHEREDIVFTTVLVLDACALTAGETKTTLNPVRAAKGDVVERNTNAVRFDVALSFPGELRPRIGNIAHQLAIALGKERVLYDKFIEGELARFDSDTYLQELYAASRLVVVVLCADYEKKEWCRLEWRQVRDLQKRRAKDIMLLKADDADVSGAFSIDGYVDMRTHSDANLVELILDRLLMSGRG
jgi:hypothetical protein